MSIFSDVISAGKNIFQKASGVLGGPIGTVLGGPIGGVLGGIVGGEISGQPSMSNLPVLPGAGRMTGFTGRSLAGGTKQLRPVYSKTGQLIDYRPVRKRRGRGFSARDIRQTRRMLALVRDVEKSCPKHRTSRASPSRTCR